MSLGEAVAPLILLTALCLGEPDILDSIIKIVNNVECTAGE